MREHVRKAYEIQRKRGVYNSHMTPEQIDEYCKLSEPCEKYVKGIEDLSPRSRANLLKLSLTIANMDGREEILMNDLLEARELSAPMFEKPNQFKYQPENTNPVAEVQNADFRIDDETISKSQIEAAIRERKLITEPVLNGEKTGLYKAFKDFEDKGVFDVKGCHVRVSKRGGLSPTGWQQLQAAMEIYRSKKFETFRYILIDRKTGEIADQLAISCNMPNYCSVSKPDNETLRQVISRAEEKDYLIVDCHNHPSGNTTEIYYDKNVTDSLDRSLRRNDGLNRFAGHIILYHDSFNVAGTASFANGDGLCFFNSNHELEGFRINRAVGNRLFPLKMPANLKPGLGLYRNNDVEFSKILASKTATRRIPVVFTFKAITDGFSLTMSLTDGSQ